ncbi:MAG: flavodoxin family protein [Oligoflexia bacterium]|nr:flavodoxin family protein [Oligoflexia bacterium]
MKILSIQGSPRKNGNSATLSKYFLESAASVGAKINTVILNELKYRGCQGCMACKTKLDKCVLKDELENVLQNVYSADVLLLSSPVYYGDVTSQMKAFIDRTYSFLVPDYTTNATPYRIAAGKKLVLILTQGHPDEKIFADIYTKYDYFFKWYGFSENHQLRACGVRNIGDIESKTDLIAQTKSLATKLCG